MLNQLNLSLRTQPASLPYKCKARLRVKLGPRAVQLARQLFPCEQTSPAGLAMTVSCQQRISAGAREARRCPRALDEPLRHSWFALVCREELFIEPKE